MTIKNNYLRLRHQALEEFARGDIGVAQTVQDKAIAALHAGSNSMEWEDFMRLFIDPDNPDGPLQLARLTGTNGATNEPALMMARSHLIANGVIGIHNEPPLSATYLDVLDDVPGIEPIKRWP
jgi:hypothetical protein